MPFGLTNAPSVFQSLINDVLRDMLIRFVVVYLDDTLVFSKTPQEHRQHVRLVLQRLLQDRLFAKAKKCEFRADTISFLGYIIFPGKVSMDPVKVSPVKQWPQPETRKQMQWFLGFTNFYCSFIRNYSQIAAPLTVLTSTTRAFVWTPEASSAFLDLKKRFTEAPILIQPDPKLHSSSRWMHLIPVWVPFCQNIPLSMTRRIPVYYSLAG